MRSMRIRSSVIAGVFIIAAAVTIGSAVALGGSSPEVPKGAELLDQVNGRIAADPGRSATFGQLTASQRAVFAVNKGDSVDVDLLAGKGKMACLQVSGGGYSSAVSCFDQDQVASTGSWLSLPGGDTSPAIMVGVTPQGKQHATVTVAGAVSNATVRNGIFVAEVAGNATANAPATVQFAP